jgi:eukaryotic-like serine/threonine-protein kinase
MAMTCTTELLNAVRQYELLEPQHLDQLRELEGASGDDPRALAQQMIKRGWLTPFQLNQVFQGRAAELLLGPYVILERLGEGGTGQVFKASHRRMRRVVALKLIRRELLSDAEVVSRFLREIQVVSQLAHPNIVHAYDAGPIGSTYFLAMEYIKGIDLAFVVKQSGPLTVTHACDCIRQAALGLQHAHMRGLVHRDIKPPNLIVVSRQWPVAGKEKFASSLTIQHSPLTTLKILDLGLARLQRAVDGEKTSLLTPAGPVMMGTPDYLAPEQALNFHAADIRADIYSLGCTFYYLLTGQPPFPGGSLAQKLLRHQQATPPPLDRLRSDVPAELVTVIRQMLAKRPEDRFQTPAEVVAALDSQQAGAPPFRRDPNDDRTIRTSLPVPQEPTTRNRSIAVRTVGTRWRSWLWCSAAAVGLVGLALGMAISKPTVGGREGPSAESPSKASAATTRSENEWTKLLARWNAAGANRQELAPVLLRFQQSSPGTAEARHASRLFRQLASPLDRFDGQTIPPERSRGWPSPELVALLGEPKGTTSASWVAFCPDGRVLAAGTDDGNVRLWDLSKGTERALLPAQRRPVKFVFTPDGQTLAVFGGAESTITLWDISGEQPQQRAVLPGHTTFVRAAVVTPDGKRLVSVAADGGIRLWDLTQRNAPECGLLERPADRVVALACSPDGQLLAALGSEGHLRMWELDRRPLRCSATVDAPPSDGFSLLAFNPESRAVVVAGIANLRAYEPKGNEPQPLWLQKFGRVMSLAMASDGQTVAGTVGNGRLILFSPTTGVHRRVWYLPVTTHHIDFAPDARHLAVACPGDTVAILRLAANQK